MDKIKIFVFDTLCLGFADCTTYLKDQTFGFPADLPDGYALFYTGNVYLIKEPYFHGGSGELWEVSQSVFDRINKRMSKMGFDIHPITVKQDGEKVEATTWIYDRAKLTKRGMKSIRINCLRDMSPSLSGKPYPTKTCC